VRIGTGRSVSIAESGVCACSGFERTGRQRVRKQTA
jgi:hypothetical protein